MEKLKKAVDDHIKLHETLSKFGADDTEPRFNFENEVRRWLRGEAFRKLTVREWELYYSMAGSTGGATRLNKSLEKVYKAYAKLSITDRPELIDFLNDTFSYVRLDA